MGFPHLCFEDIGGGNTFIEIFLERVRQIDFVDKKIAALHKNVDVRIGELLKACGNIEVMLIDDSIPTYFEHHRLIWKSRKWCHQSLRGGAKEATLYDEWMPMDLLQQVTQQVDAMVLLYLHPEQPFFDVEYARQIVKAAAVEHGEKARLSDFPLMTRQTASGIAPVALTHIGVRELAKKNWSPRHAFSPTNGHDGFWVVRDHVFHDTDADMARENFCLRSKRDAKRLSVIAARLKQENQAITLKNMIKLRSAAPECLLEDTPREIDVDIVGRPKVGRDDFPKLKSNREMPLEIIEKVLYHVCSIDDALLTIGVHGNVLKHSELSKIKSMLSMHKPYGLQLCWDASTMMEQGVDYSWFEMDFDFLNIDLTGLSLEGESKLEEFEPEVERLMKASAMYGDRSPIIHLEISKCRENWRVYEMVYRWSLKYRCNVNWLGRNDMAGQIPMEEETFYFPPKRYPCEKLRFQMYIRNDGGVSLCKQDYLGKYDMGNISNQTLHEIWNMPAAVEHRKRQLAGDYNLTPLCTACKHWVHT